MGLLEPVLYSIPFMADTLKNKYTEFNLKKKEGRNYERNDLVDAGIKSITGLLGYAIEEFGNGGMVQKLIVKNASKYIAEIVADALMGSK